MVLRDPGAIAHTDDKVASHFPVKFGCAAEGTRGEHHMPCVTTPDSSVWLTHDGDAHGNCWFGPACRSARPGELATGVSCAADPPDQAFAGGGADLTARTVGQKMAERSPAGRGGEPPRANGIVPEPRR
jgi:hypothetical protein